MTNISKTAPTAAPSGMPDLSSLMAGLGGGGGGAGGLAGLMRNPAMMQMAQQMMQNPAMMQQAMSMLGGGGGGGGAPDLSALSGMMAGLTGGGAGGNGGGIPAFSGFQDDAEEVSPMPANPTPSPAGGMMDKIRNSPEFLSLQSDPSCATVFQMLQRGDYQGAMRAAEGNPEVMQKIMGAMSALK